jgi:hypothetical protein
MIGQDRKILSKAELDRKAGVQIPTMTFNGLLAAIPRKWKKMLDKDANIKNYYVFIDYKVMIDDTQKKLIETSTKDL